MQKQQRSNTPSGHARSKPRLGQHFLTSPAAPAQIVRALGNLEDATVLEIGPGRGAITGLLAAAAQRLIAVEYDRALAAQLTAHYSGNPRVEILSGDILSVDLQALAAREGRALRVVGNLPYYITSDILLHLFAHHTAIDRAVLMVQREVAGRITAIPGSRDYGLLTATTELYARAESLFTLPPGAFSPPPDVHSTVFRLEMAPRLRELGVEAAPFMAFLRRCFAQKRKTLSNNLRAAGYGGQAVQRALAACSLPAQVRAEAAGLAAMACLFHQLGAPAATD